MSITDDVKMENDKDLYTSAENAILSSPSPISVTNQTLEELFGVNLSENISIPLSPKPCGNCDVLQQKLYRLCNLVSVHIAQLKKDQAANARLKQALAESGSLIQKQRDTLASYSKQLASVQKEKKELELKLQSQVQQQHVYHQQQQMSPPYSPPITPSSASSQSVHGMDVDLKVPKIACFCGLPFADLNGLYHHVKKAFIDSNVQVFCYNCSGRFWNWDTYKNHYVELHKSYCLVEYDIREEHNRWQHGQMQQATCCQKK